MCGIYGIAKSGTARQASPATRAEISPEAIARATGLLAHRGPDDAGVWVVADRSVGFGHRRLAVLDLTPAGHQPMAGPRGHVLCFNGEIYNFRALRAELERLGHPFAGTGDAEVLLAAYAAWGEECVGRLNGMFAFAVYDPGGNGQGPSLFLARDPAGEKPLYYHHTADTFEFASEVRALEHGGRIDPLALDHYLALGYIPGDLCLFEGVHKLPAAHTARLDLGDFSLRTRRYRELPGAPVGETGSGTPAETDVEALERELEHLLEDAVRLRLESDVPLGVLLSGGLDSGLVLAAASRVSSRPIEAFTVSLPDSPLDESRRATQVARHFGAHHHILPLAPTGLGVLHDLAPLVDEPLGDSSLIPSFLVSALTRRHVTVALGGDGGDELFGGYTAYVTGLNALRRAGWMPRPLLALAGAARYLPAGLKGRAYGLSLRHGALQQASWYTTFFDPRLRHRLYRNPPPLARADAPERWHASLLGAPGAAPIHRLCRQGFLSTLTDDFLVKVDRASMAHALEMRSPWLDPRLIDFAFGRIPASWKVQGNATRRLQRRLAARLLPPDAEVPRKQGFSIPMDAWLRADRCQWVRDTLPDLPDSINRVYVEKLIHGHMRGRANGARLFALIMLAFANRNARRH
ncbi:MAG: asparagine synthase (glutamine-hydrolyzing) [Nitrospirota bacterium]|nr:asparagine synthase (glutamine-hydrolyzing) [Nitrospirota bacterium]